MVSRSVMELAEAQSRRWRLARKQVDSEAAPQPQPVITVSREIGVGGTQIGALVAERLGYKFWDQQILLEMAEHAHVSEVLLSALDEHPKNVFLEAFAAYEHGHPTSSDYMRELRLQLHAIALHGNAVLIGRGAQFTLDPAKTFRVRIFGRRDLRIRRVAAKRGITVDQATTEVDRVDAEYATFTREQWSRDIGEIQAYDLLLNVEYLGPEAAADAIVAAYRARFELPR